MKIVVPAGVTVCIGRLRPPADFSVPNDTRLSRLHFSLSFDGERLTIQDLNSTNGLFVNGERVPWARLNPFDTVAAGSSRFSVNFGPPAHRAEMPQDIPAPAVEKPFERTLNLPDADATIGYPALPQTMTGFLGDQPGTLYGILDGARGSRVLEVLRQSGAEYYNLYDGKSAEDLEQFAPYLVRFSKENGFLLAQVLSEGRGRNWGVFLNAGVSTPDLRCHLRQFLTVILPGGKYSYFRFYDPRVMRCKIVTGFDAAEAARFFGPVSQYLCEHAESNTLLRLRPSVRGVDTQVIRVAPG